jgi:DNA processing protein
VTGAERDAAWAEGQRAAEALARRGAVVIDILCPDYPAGFRNVHDAPPACFFLGRHELLGAPIVTIVGSRACTSDGVEAARWLAAQLTAAGLVVASGLARGVDAAAHEGALAAGGATLAVLGSGFDVAYPQEHVELQMEIERRGLLVSEFLPDTGPRPYHFPRRNRLLAALARGVIVVEARVKSGALITSDHALDLGKAVMVVPGPILSPTHAGSNNLLREGATPVLEIDDVLHCLRHHGWDGQPWRREAGAGAEPSGSGVTETPTPADAAEPPGLASAERRVWHALEARARHVDEVSARSGLGAAETLSALSSLEFRGLARQLSGLRFARG